jgi:hypothetical protein
MSTKPLEPADEVGYFGRIKLSLFEPFAEPLTVIAGAAGEDEDGRPDGVRHFALLKLPILHRREEIT